MNISVLSLFVVETAARLLSSGLEVAAALPGIVRAEVLKDDRVLDVKVSCTFASSSGGLVTVTLALWVTLSETGEAFPMTLTAGEAGVQLSMGAQ